MLAKSSLLLGDYWAKDIPVQLGLIVKSHYASDCAEDVDTIDASTGWVIRGWYIENDGETYVRCLAIHEGDCEVEDCHKFIEYNSNTIAIEYLTPEQQEWIGNNGSCYFSQPVRLKPSSTHFDNYKDANFVILSVEGNELNAHKDSSKGAVQWTWHNDENWVILGLNANEPIDESLVRDLTLPDDAIYDEFNFLELMAANTTLIAVRFSEIYAVEPDVTAK